MSYTTASVTLDLHLLRTPEGIALVKESQRRRSSDSFDRAMLCRDETEPALKCRNSNVDLVDEVAAMDTQWRKLRHDRDLLKKEYNSIDKEIGKIKKLARNGGEDTSAVLIAKAQQLDSEIKQKDQEETRLKTTLDTKFLSIANLVHEDVPVNTNEDFNKVVTEWGVCSTPAEALNHHDLLLRIDGYISQKGADIAGHRGYFLKGVGVRLNQALINYSIDFLAKKGFTEVQPPYFMNHDVMAKTAQLSDFSEQLYSIDDISPPGATGPTPSNVKYLIATSEQPISALHMDEYLSATDLPKKYTGYSTNFRKEAGGHGRDVRGIFRVHQFEKIEQFAICQPEKSWEMHEALIKNAEEFYQSLNIPYRVVSIVSGALNDAASKKYDLEGWFPSEQRYRELVSCSNCTDYQSRRLNIRYRGGETAQFVHMLNSTLCATSRTICAILENYQCESGIRVPAVLQPYMGGKEIIPFVL